MTITELINKLSQLRDKYGDLECTQQSGEEIYNISREEGANGYYISIG